MFNFEGKKVLILGGTGDIGSVIAKLFSEKKALVCRHGTKGKYRADLKSTSQIKSLWAKVFLEYGGIDIIVNSSSFAATRDVIEKKSWKSFQNHLEIQLKSSLETTLLALPYMKSKGWGRIVNIASSYTVGKPPGGLADYVTAKYGLLGLTKALAVELGRFGITVNAVSPSFIRNSFTRSIPDKFGEILTSQTPLGRLASEEDVAHVVMFLASDLASYITGENLIIGGGSIMD